MKNSFSVEVSLSKVPLKPFEWSNVSNINDLKLKRVTSKFIETCLLNDVKFNLKDKYLLLSDCYTTIVLKLDSSGKTVLRSFLSFEKDIILSEYANALPRVKLEYEILPGKVKYSSFLQEENQMKKYIIKSIIESDDESKSRYLYYLYFQKVDDYSKDRLIKSIKDDELNRCIELYNFLIRN